MGFLAALGKGAMAKGVMGKGAAGASAAEGASAASSLANQPVKVDGFYSNPATRVGNDASAVSAPEGLRGSSGKNSASFGSQMQGMAKGISGGGSTYQAPTYNQFQPGNVDIKNDGQQFSQLMEFLRSQGSGLR